MLPLDLVRFDSAASVEAWHAIDDRVMGGVSRSQLRYHPDAYAVFEGQVSLERNGGFASVRTVLGGLPLTGVSGYWLDVMGDGKRYKINLRTDDGFDGISYQAAFEPAAGIWTRIQLALADFRPSFRGRPVADAPAFDPSRLRQVGLMISDRQPGSFALALRSICAQ